jgi:hypothetical protein
MSQTRVVVAAVVVVLFIAAGGVLIYLTRSHGGKDVTFNVSVTSANHMNPSDLTANQNDNVTINVSSDTDGEVHLHGYDIHFDTKAGQTVTHTFKADKTGDFEIEWESTSTLLGHFVVS